ncbi:MAG TPA: hypothetical protein VL334_25545 [Anaerolineae bacterium]|nr:hypothetical protein [Anaerolineae bacterium]
MADRNRTYLFIVVAFIVGLLIGWFALGWGLAPVQYTGARLNDLRAEDQQTFVAAQAEAFAQTQDNRKAIERLQTLGTQEHVAGLAAQVIQQAEATGDMVTADRVRSMAAAIGLAVATPAPAPSQPAEEPQQGGSSLATILGLALLAGGIVLAAWLLLRGRSAADAGEEALVIEPLVEEKPAYPPGRHVPPPPAPGPTAERSSAGQEFTAAFHQGDVAYDQSFDIEGPDGSYWGECGMTMSEAVHGDPERATALEVWLFDKSDIRTVTKVLMSDYAYGNQALREKLSSRGDAVLLAPDLGFVLDAQTLRLMGKIVELEYDDSQAPARGTIRRLRVQLRVMRQVV